MKKRKKRKKNEKKEKKEKKKKDFSKERVTDEPRICSDILYSHVYVSEDKTSLTIDYSTGIKDLEIRREAIMCKLERGVI